MGFAYLSACQMSGMPCPPCPIIPIYRRPLRYLLDRVMQAISLAKVSASKITASLAILSALKCVKLDISETRHAVWQQQNEPSF